MSSVTSTPHSRTAKYLLAALLAVVTLAIFLPTVRQGWIRYDDDFYVFRNPEVRKGLGPLKLGFKWSQTSPSVPIPLVLWPNVAWAFRSEVQGNWHPLTMVSHLADVSIYGTIAQSPAAQSFARSALGVELDPNEPWPGGQHLTSALIHTASVLLLFTTLCRWTGCPYRSALVAALFAWHPTRVESVAWIAERKDVLAGFFWVLTMAAYGRYVRNPGWFRYLLVTLSLTCGLMCKAMLVTFPFVLLLLDYWPLRRFSFARAGGRFDRGQAVALLLEKLPWFALVGVFSYITFEVQSRTGFVVSWERQSFAERLITVTNAYGGYLWNAVWPTRLCIIYPLPIDVRFDAWTGFSAALFVALSALALTVGRRRPYVIVGWLWFVGTLVPVIGLVQIGGTAMADRYTYLPFIGLFVAVVWWWGDLVSALQKPSSRNAAVVASVAVLAGFAALTVRQVRFWDTPVGLFQRALDVTDRNYLAHLNLANALSDDLRLAEAVVHYERTLVLWPTYPVALYNKALVLCDLARYEEAREALRQCNHMSPNDANTLYFLGKTEERLDQLTPAAAYYHAALDIRYQEDAALALGYLYNRLGRPDEALRIFDTVQKLSRNNTSAPLGTAWILATHSDEKYRDPPQALAIAAQVAERVGDDSRLWISARDVMAAALAANGRYDDAIKYAQGAYERSLKEERDNLTAGLIESANDAAVRSKAIARRINQYYERRRPYFVNPADFPH